MPVELTIRDGDPWWLSPDIWVVPGNNPEGEPGAPMAGQDCFIWARVSNEGRSSVQNATVRFYWANPAAGFDRDTAVLVGTANVNLDGGETTEVLCLTPWRPTLVNNGHSCVLAEVFHADLDPLPATVDFNVVTDRHVAQRNLTVVSATAGMFMAYAEFHNRERHARRFVLRLVEGEIGALKPLAKTIGRPLPKELGQFRGMAFARERCPNLEDTLKKGEDQLEVEIPAHSSVALTVVAHFDGPAALVHVEQAERDPRRPACKTHHGKAVPLGGLSILAINTEKKVAR